MDTSAWELPGSDVPPSSSADPKQDLRDLEGDQALPKELSSDDSYLSIDENIQRLEELLMGWEGQKMWGDMGKDLPPSQPAQAEKGLEQL